jgi:hypothetical protein
MNLLYEDILAAGTAIGMAGEWEGMKRYLSDSYNAGSFGQVSFASAGFTIPSTIPLISKRPYLLPLVRS